MSVSQHSPAVSQDDYLREVHRNIVRGGIKTLPSIAPEVRQKILSKLPPEKQHLINFDAKSVNALIKAASSMNEDDFIAFAKDPASVPVKLGPAELEALRGGGRGRLGFATTVLGAASVIATVGAFGLSAGGCFSVVMIGWTLDNP